MLNSTTTPLPSSSKATRTEKFAAEFASTLLRISSATPSSRVCPNDHFASWIHDIVKGLEEETLLTALVYLARLKFGPNDRGMRDTPHRLILSVSYPVIPSFNIFPLLIVCDRSAQVSL